MNVSPDILPAPVRRCLLDVLPNAETAIWNRLGGGRTNRCWRGDTGTDSIVVKLFSAAKDNPLFPNDPGQEASVLRELAGQGLAPELLAEFETPLGHCIAYRHVDGDLWASGTNEVGQAMRKLHNTPPVPGLRMAETLPAALEQQALSMSDRARDVLPLLPRKPGPVAAQPVFLHGDIVAGNLIRTSTGLTLIDWQAPGVGDACHDIAVFLSPAMMQLYRGAALSAQEIDAFFEGYGSDSIRQRYHLLAPWLHLRLYAYCHWKAGQGHSDYVRAAQAELNALHQNLASYPSQSLTA